MGMFATVVEAGLSDGFSNYINSLKSEVQEAYLENDTPWIVCFSGGKDSTALLQLVFYALAELGEEDLTKEIHVLSNDTLVENPSIIKHLDEQLERIRLYGQEKLYKHNPSLFFVEKGQPQIEDRFWVNLIGKGYPSPNRWFRWCTERLKINPTSKYINDSLKKHEKVIIVLGTRKAESANRAASMKKHDTNGRYRNHTLPNALVYAPIADMSNDDVWAYILRTPNPWGSDNMDLLGIYGHACNKGECPFVIETGTQSCGKSRFGCWVCTVVDRDRSMENFINNGEKWMGELLGFRNWLYEIRQADNQYIPNRIRSKVKFSGFLLETRKRILQRLLNIQGKLEVELVGQEELALVRKILDEECLAQTKDGLKRFILELPKGKKIAVISDYDILKTGRSRIGPIYTANAKTIKCENVSPKYTKSTRVMYYPYEGSNGSRNGNGGAHGHSR